MMSSRRMSCFCCFVASFWMIFLMGSYFSEQAPFKSFAKDATSAQAEERFDYIIIGGGTAGCPLAATLSANAKVLLLERGDLPYGNRNVTNISGFALTLADTSPTSPSQLFISTDGVINHRARVLGGGSAINAGFYTRASADYVKEVGWEPRAVEESFQWVEKKVAFSPKLQEWETAVRDGLLEAGVLPYRGFTFEHLMGTKIGGSIFDENGYRHTAADLLEYAQPSNISVYLNATVHQILFSISPGKRPKAYGVLYVDSKGTTHVANLNDGPMNEIILSAGAMGSPQLLMLSGIGPAQQLQAQGITVILDQQMVGQGMSDNPLNALLIPSPRPVEVSLVKVVGISPVGSFVESACGFVDLIWATTRAVELARIENKTAGRFTDPTNDTFPASAQARLRNIQAGIIVEKIMGPYSTGYMELQNKDPKDNPRVTFNYFQDPRDLERCVQGMDIIRRVVESRSFSTFKYPDATFQSLTNFMLTIPNNLRRRHLTSTYSLEQYCQDTVMTIWHYHGGCQVNRVVDPDYRVLGVDGLRVIDGSTFYNSPGTNPQGTVMMLGRYMGVKILSERVQK